MGTGKMHGILPIHLGMRVRLLDALDHKKTLVKDAEGEIVRIEPHEEDSSTYENAFLENGSTRPIYLKKLPKGIWVRMDKYDGAPFAKHLEEHDSNLKSEDTKNLVFIEPHTSDSFTFREKYKVVRT